MINYISCTFFESFKSKNWTGNETCKKVCVFDSTSAFESCKKVCVFDSAPTLGLYNMSKPNVALSSSVNS